MNKIHVGLYGDGSRNARLREEIIYCDKADKCSMYREGKCLNITSPFASYCPFGSVTRVDGGTKRSKTFQRVGDQARRDECYCKLKRAYGTRFAVVDDVVVIGGMSAHLGFSSAFTIKDPGFCGGNYIAIPKSEFTVDIIKRIYSFRPQALMGGVLKQYIAEQLPFFFQQMKRLWPEKYAEFAAAEPSVRELVPNYIGKWAKLSTINHDSIIDGYRFDGDYIVGEFKSAFLPFRARSAHIRIPITDDLMVKITDNNQVTEDTIFE